MITISSVATIGVHAEMAAFGYSQAKAALEQWTKAMVRAVMREMQS
jgi:NAD(P)-dependent dehydrogenase (short-subunit alcohol dehydrogenase family)